LLKVFSTPEERDTDVPQKIERVPMKKFFYYIEYGNGTRAKKFASVLYDDRKGECIHILFILST